MSYRGESNNVVIRKGDKEIKASGGAGKTLATLAGAALVVLATGVAMSCLGPAGAAVGAAAGKSLLK